MWLVIRVVEDCVKDDVGRKVTAAIIKKYGRSRHAASTPIADDTIGAVVERPTVALCVAGSSLQVVVPGLAVCICEVSLFVNATTMQDLFLVCGND